MACHFESELIHFLKGICFTGKKWEFVEKQMLLMAAKTITIFRVFKKRATTFSKQILYPNILCPDSCPFLQLAGLNFWAHLRPAARFEAHAKKTPTRYCLCARRSACWTAAGVAQKIRRGFGGGLEKLFFPLGVGGKQMFLFFAHTHTAAPEDEVSLIARANLIHCGRRKSCLSRLVDLCRADSAQKASSRKSQKKMLLLFSGVNSNCAYRAKEA